MTNPRLDPTRCVGSDYQRYLAEYGVDYDRLLAARLARLAPTATWLADGARGYAVVQPLPWDTDVLGVRTARLEYVFVARACRPRRPVYERLLRQALAWARRARVRLLIARLATGEVELVQALERHGFYTVDTLQTFLAVPPARRPPLPRGIGTGRPDDIPRVGAIARAAFTESRLYRDPRLSRRQAGNFYHRLARQIAATADHFAVVRDRGRVQGFCLGTIDADGAAGGKALGSLWLVATAPAARGRGLGRRLVAHFLAAMSRRVDLIEISTQAGNPAARLYLEAGARPEALITTLHRWLPR